MRIAILCLPAIGDALMCTPMIRLLKKRRPKVQIDVICIFDSVAYIFKNNPNVSRIHKVDIHFNQDLKSRLVGLNQILALRRIHYDLSILPLPAYRREYHLIHWLIGGKKRISHRFEKGYFREMHFLNTKAISFDPSVHNVINNLNLLKAIDIDWMKSQFSDFTYDLSLDLADVNFGREFLKMRSFGQSNLIGIHPGSTSTPTSLLKKRWPIERYAKVADYLIREKKKRIIIFVGPHEVGLGKALYRKIRHKNCLLVNNLPFNQALGILSFVPLLICNDNGFGHVAVALGKKVVTLWAPTNPTWSRPLNNSLVTIIRPEGFIPWYTFDLLHNIPKGLEDGMDQISVDQVLEVLKEKV